MRYFGKLGYIKTFETAPGVWIEDIPIEREYYGEVTRLQSRWENSGNVNDNINLNNQISIIADPFAYENFQYIKYIEFMGALWNVSSIEVQRPRLIITMGGVYNGQQT